MLTISDYKNWASQNQRTAVALNRNSTGLVAESTRIGIFAGAFRRGAVKDIRGDVLRDFTRALGARYGATIAQQAVSMAGLKPTSQLKGSKIARAISAAKDLRAQMLQSATGQNLSLGNTEVSGADVRVMLEDKRNAVSKFLKQRAVAVQLLGEMPLTQAEFDDFHVRAWSIVARLVRLRSTAVAPANIPEADFQEAVSNLIQAIYDKDARAREVIDTRPLGDMNLNEYKSIWCDAAVNAMVALGDEATRAGNDPAAAAITHAFTKLCNDHDVRKAFDDSIVRFSHGASKKYVAPFVVNLLKRQLAEEGVRDFGISTSDIVKKIDAGFQKNLNERPWVIIDKPILASVGNRPVSLRSRIAPAEQLGHADDADRGPIAARYPNQVHGYMCDSSTADHAVNLSVSSIAVGEPGGAQSVAFSGVRHGVHSAWGIRNDAQRAAANARRAEEAVIAAFLAKFDGPGNHPALPAQGEDGRTTVDLNMTSVSLLTPGTFRHTFKTGSAVDERRMLMDQSAAWDSVARNGVEFEYKGRLIKIRPRILKFNFGVNEGAVNKLFRLTPDVFGGWDISKQMNKAAFAALAEEVEAFMQTDADESRKTAAHTLLEQCRRALDARAERRDAHDAFKVAARIAVLSNLIGKVPCWNCKSGKDRTGQMDVECKFLSTLIARGEQIPAPGARLTKEQQGLLRAIALEGGNFEIQKMNTGIAGFKTGSINSVTERLGGKEFREFHRGGSDHVNV